MSPTSSDWRAGLPTGIRLHAGLMADEQLTVRMPEGELPGCRARR